MSLEELLAVNIEVASDRPSTLLNSVSVVSTIDRNTIELFGFKSVEDALVTISGFDIQRSYLKQSIPTSRGVLQDHYANKILFMIDGISNWQAFGGDPVIGRIDINNVERIEVLKGPASVLYGTNAYVGAINIIMKKEQQKSISAGVGTDNLNSFGVSHRDEFEGGRYSLALNHRNREEFSINFLDENGVTAPIDEYQRNNNLHFDVVYHSHQLTINAYDGEESYYGSNISFAGGAGTNHTLDGYFIHYVYNQNTSNWGVFKISGLLDDQSNEFDVDTLPTRLFWEGAKSTFSIDSVIDIGSSWVLESGLEAEHRDSKNSRFMNPNGFVDVNGVDKTINENSLHSQLYYNGEKHRWVVGGRLVDNSLFGSDYSSRASYVYMFNNKNSLKLIAGQSFRSPSLFELYGQIGCCILGQELLQPEKADSVELAYLSAWDNWFLQSSIYWAEYRNKIVRGVEYDFVLPNGEVLDNVNRYRNGNDFESTGLEVELKYNSHNWSGFANFTYVDGNKGDKFEDEDHYNFKYVPNLMISAGLSRKWNNWSLAINGTYRDSSKSISNGVSSSFIADFALTYRTALPNQSELNHQLVFRNLTNSKVMVPEYARRRVVDELPLRVEQVIGYEIRWIW